MVKLNVAADEGVPVMAPLPVFKVKPAGSVPTDTDQLYGDVPPLADNVCGYATPTVVLASVDGVILIAPAIVSDSALSAEAVTVSVTVKV